MTEQNLNHEPVPTGARLSEADIAALDALVESSFEARGDARTTKVAALLALLASDAKPHPSLADVTMARVMRAGRAPAGADVEPVLSEDDEAALESWIGHGYEAGRVAPSLRERARRHAALASMAVSGEALARPDLVERTLAGIDAFEEAASESRRLPVRRRGLSVRLADLVSAAAVVLVGAGVVFPVLSALREQSRRGLCNSNLGNTATAMSTYAGANRDELPVAAASLGGGSWWDVGTPDHSNSANLYTLARDNYVPVAMLACPGNPDAPTAPASPDARDWRRLAEVSYSYQIMFGPRPAWNGQYRIVVLADRSPLVLRSKRQEQSQPTENAPNHRGAGQHLLSNDGSVIWATSPNLPNGDNIWLPRSLEVRDSHTRARGNLTGRELPADAEDTFLGP